MNAEAQNGAQQTEASQLTNLLNFVDESDPKVQQQASRFKAILDLTSSSDPRVFHCIKHIANSRRLNLKYSPLTLAIRCEYMKYATALIKSGFSVHGAEGESFTPLHVATQGTSLNLFNEILARGADVDTQTHPNRETPLHIAMQKNFFHYTKILLDAGANPNIRDANGRTPLYWAVEKNNIVLARFLMEGYNADPNIRDVFIESTTLLEASIRNKTVDMTILLLKNGADPNTDIIKSERVLGKVLHLAMIKQQWAVRELLSKGADPNIRYIDIDGIAGSYDSRSRTPLGMAITYGWNFVAMLLVEFGADPNEALRNGNTPLNAAIYRIGSYELVSKLLQKGANVRAKGLHGYTPLRQAQITGRSGMVPLIREYLEFYDLDYGTLYP